MGFEASAAVSPTSLVMSRRTADLRGARAGDVVTLLSARGAGVDFSIGAVIADEITGGTELLITPEGAQRLGLQRKSSVVMWGFDSRSGIDRALADNGLETTAIRIRRSWDAFDPDSGLGMAETKELLGEFGYRTIQDSVWLTIEAAWLSANILSNEPRPIALSANCHRGIESSLQAALAEIRDRGLAWTIDTTNSNRYGGCFAPRFNRLTPNSTIGFLSRHSWGMAIDLNTVENCQGCAPPGFAQTEAGCDAVRIFRKHGFAWGGNYLTPDGMHFEYVGEPRDQLPYPSRYCPNIVGDNALVITQRATLFDDAGLVAE